MRYGGRMSMEELTELRKLLETPSQDGERSSLREDAGLLVLGLIWGCVLGVIGFVLRYGPTLGGTRGCP